METILDIRGRGPKAEEYKTAIRKEFLDLVEAQIPIGDLNKGKSTIEIKLPDDFLASITDGRLREQPIHMKENYNDSLILLLGSLTDLIAQNILNSVDKEDGQKHLSENAILGAFASVLARHKMPIVPLDNVDPIKLLTYVPNDDKRYVSYIAKVNDYIHERDLLNNKFYHAFKLMHYYLDKCNDGKPVDINPIRRKASSLERQVHLLTSFAGISEEKSKKLLIHFKTIKNVMNATEKELQAVDKIGPKISKDIVELVEKQYVP